MPDTSSTPKIDHLTDRELLSLYLSLPQGPRDKAFLSTAQAAAVTGVSARTIQLWIESGAVRAISIGRKYRILFESLQVYLEAQMNRRGS